MPDSRSFRPLFEEFIAHLTIDSKETGIGPLIPWGSQQRFLDELCEGLDAGKRFFVCLKARQLGISTISLAVTLFWLLVHDGTQGALICDDESNKEKFRILLDRYLHSLPRSLRVSVNKHNRNVLSLKNGSNLDYLTAGKKKGNITLGQSRGLNFVHATEVGSWGSEEGLASLISSLARVNPDRLFMFESTAHGHNLFYEIWNGAIRDDLNKKAFFVGWWSNPLYRIARNTPQFARYWDGKEGLEDYERELVDQVRERYGHKITQEQIAWHRYMRSEEILDPGLMDQNFPWHADHAFVATGQGFFPLSKINDDFKFVESHEAPFKGYIYHLGENNFLETEVVQVDRPDLAQLKVWEEPTPLGTYVMGIDPAYGRGDFKDRHAIPI